MGIERIGAQCRNSLCFLKFHRCLKMYMTFCYDATQSVCVSFTRTGMVYDLCTVCCVYMIMAHFTSVAYNFTLINYSSCIQSGITSTISTTLISLVPNDPIPVKFTVPFKGDCRRTKPLVSLHN